MIPGAAEEFADRMVGIFNDSALVLHVRLSELSDVAACTWQDIDPIPNLVTQ